MLSLAAQFLIGVVLLLIATDLLVKLATKLSQNTKISPLIIGATVVAIGTSLPELAVSTTAVFRGDGGLAMGNIVGSNIANILLVLPIGIFIGKIHIGTTKTQRNAVLLFLATIIFIIMQLTSVPKVFLGGIFVFLAILVTIGEYEWAILGRSHEDLKRFITTKKRGISWSMVLLLILLVVAIIVGGILMVSSVEKISQLTGYSTTILGLTLTAVATSLPELFATIFSQEDKDDKMTIGSIFGSNIYNLLLIGGIVTLISSSQEIPLRDWLWLFGTSSLFVAILIFYKGKTVPKKIGVIFLFLFVVYLLTF